MNYLTFEEEGLPLGEDFKAACEALFTLLYIIKFEISRKKLNMDYKVYPMEVTWNLHKCQEKTEFPWTMMIMQPEFITKDMVSSGVQIAKEKGKNIDYRRVSFKAMNFGKCIQYFHKGDYNNMNDTLAKITDFAHKNHYECDKYTHDIYLNDSRKTKVENYKTIMRVRVYEE